MSNKETSKWTTKTVIEKRAVVGDKIKGHVPKMKNPPPPPLKKNK